MNIKECLNNLNEETMDTCDTVFDSYVTVNQVDNTWDDDGYKRFNEYINENVDVESVKSNILVCNWSKFIENNEPALKNFMKDNWKAQYKDSEDFKYEWIEEINQYLAGNVSDKTYDTLLDDYLLKPAEKTMDKPSVNKQNKETKNTVEREER